MKKFFTVILIIVNISCFAQANNWFVSFSVAPSIGGPAASLKKQMKEQGYGDNEGSSFVIFGSGNTQYPRGGAIALLATAGKRINERKSIYFVAGLAGTATIEGFDAQGYSDGFFGLFAGTYGNYVSVDYNIYQFSAGYMYSFPRSRTQLGFAPTLYLFNYGIWQDYAPKNSHNSIVPGIAVNTRIPMGKQKKMIGTDFVFNMNMAPSVKMKSEETKGFQPKTASMVSANIGFALCLRK